MHSSTWRFVQTNAMKPFWATARLQVAACCLIFLFPPPAMAVSPPNGPGTALSFDGLNDQLTAATAVPTGDSPYTIEAWIKPLSMHVGTIAAWGTFGAPNQVNAFRLAPTGLVNYWWANDLAVNINLAGAWHHVAASFDGTTRQIVVDGLVVGSDMPSGHNASGANFSIGAANNGEFFNGQIDELRIWSVGRTAEQILSDMRRQLRGDEPGLVAYYRFDESTGLQAFDSSSALVSYWPFDGNAAAARGGNGTISGNVTTASDRDGIAGGALAFNGLFPSSVSVAGGGGLNAATSATISLWVKWTGFQDADCCGTYGAVLARQANVFFSDNIIALDGPDPGSARIVWRQASAGGGPAPTLISSMGSAGTDWRHIAVSISATGSTLYVDGVSQSTAVGDPLHNNPSIPLSIGAWIGDGGGYATASIDDVAVWNKPLSSDQIAQLASQTSTPLDVDNGGNSANAATLLNGPAWVGSTIVPFAPPVTTLAASLVTETNAYLNGTVDGRTSTDRFTAYFEWGTDESFGHLTPMLSLAPGTPPQDWDFPLSGLAVGTTYCFRAVARNSFGTSYGNTLTFRTHPPGIALPATRPDLKLFTSGEVRAMAVQLDGKIVIGGSFQSVNEVPRLNLARLNPNGSVDLTWNPPSPNYDVYSLCINGTNLFVGGQFSQIGTSNRLGLAKFNLADSGSLDPDWTPLLFQSASLLPVVRSLAIFADQLYVGGIFVQAGGLNRTNLTRMSPFGNGQVDVNWAPNPDLEVLTILPSEQGLFAGGRFTRIGGLDRTNAAKLFANGVGACDPAWDPRIIQTLPAGAGGVLSLASDSTSVFVGGDFVLTGAAARTNLAKVDVLSGNADPAWFPVDKASSVRSIALTNNSVFAAGFFGTSSFDTLVKLSKSDTGARDSGWRPEPFQSTNGSPKVNVILAANGGIYVGGAVSRFGNEVRLGLAKVDAIVGSVDRQFNAQVQYPGYVRALARQPDGKVIIGGDFYFVGGLPRQNLARVNADGTLDITWAPATSGPVLALAWSSNSVFVGGSFTNVSGFPRRFLARISTAGRDAVDELWNPSPNARVLGFATSGTNLFVSGDFFLIGGQLRFRVAKVSTLGTGEVDSQWNPGLFPKSGFSTPALALSGDDLFMGGFFDSVGGLARTNLVKVSATGTGAVDPLWNPGLIGANPPPPDFAYAPEVSALQVVGTNLFVAGFYTNVGGVPRAGLAKLSTLGTGVVDADWIPQLNTGLPGNLSVSAVALDGTNLYAGGLVIDIGFGQYSQPVLKISTEGAGFVDPDFHVYHSFLNALVTSPTGVYLGGNFASVSGDYVNFAARDSFALMTVPCPPQLIQDTATNLFIVRNSADGSEITHFRITAITNGTLYHSDGVTPLSAGDFITVAEGEAGLRFDVGGSVTVVSAVSNLENGAGTASTTLTMNANPTPAFRFSSANYSVREGQDNIVVIVRKYGNGAAMVNYSTADLSATALLDYQPLSGALNFTAFEKVKNIVIPIANDLQTEGDEQFTVTLTNASPGAGIAGPATVSVTIVDNDIVGTSDSVTTTFAPSAPPTASGGLMVTLNPPEAGGQWRLLGELTWHNSTGAIGGLVTGNYAIEFSPVRGYRQPDVVTVPISAGATSQLAFFYASIATLGTGALSVNIQPFDVATSPNTALRGQWQRQGEGIWRDSDDTVFDLPVGSYTIEFKSVPGRLTPSPLTVEVGAGATYGSVGTYFVGTPPNGITPTVVPFETATTNAPYIYNGQIQTSVGFGSGFVVKQRVVLTAAHVLFDDIQLSYSAYARWFFERYRDQLEPVPLVPRGWYVFEGYAAQRQLDNRPGVSTPLSQNLDAAALYFLEDAGRGGFGGYLSSDTDNNEYLLSANNKFLAGYPLESVAATDRGKLFATAPMNLTFTRLYTSIFATTNAQSFPGNSGGPLYVQADIEKYLPAGLVLGGSGQTLVRAINSEVVDLINRAEISANGGGNIVGGGVIVLSPGITTPPFGTGLLTVKLSPSSARSSRPGWRIAGDQNADFLTNSQLTVALIGGGGYPIEFKAIPGFLAPSNRTIQLAVGGTVTIQADYVPIPSQLTLNSLAGLSIVGGLGASYSVEFATNLTPPSRWMPLTTVTLAGSTLVLSNTRPIQTGQRFYRSVLMP